VGQRFGEKDKAFAALEEVYNAHSNCVGYFKIVQNSILCATIRGLPRC
jgi:hypothetical protein